MMVGRLDRPGRFEEGPLVQGHTGSVLDMDFNPFDDSMFASASEDTTIKIWSIPDDFEPTDESGMAKPGADITESLVDLLGHKKKVTLVRYHPSAANILASTAADGTVKIWDIEKSEAVSSYDDLPDLAQDIVWDYCGDQYATSCKDKIVRIMDGRLSTVATSFEAHEGNKSVKLQFLGETAKFLSVGSSKVSSREVKIWDLKNLSKPVHTETIDTASGGMIPLYDNDTNVVYLCGKGDGIMRVYEFEDTAPYFFKLNDGFRSTNPTKGACLVPKRGLDVMKHETACVLKLTNNQGVQPLRFFVPRKSDAFQDDIFPDTPGNVPAHSADEWLNGSSKAPALMSLDPARRGGTSTKKKSFQTVGQLTAKLDAAKKRIDYLEAKLKENRIAFT